MADDLLPREQRLAAFYARVMHRVSQRFEQRVGADDDDDDAARERRRTTAIQLEERWRERLSRYTGHTRAALVVHEPSPRTDEGDSRKTATVSTDAAVVEAPHGLHQLRAPRSIFATILSGKRKIEQLDGTVEDTNDAGEEAKDAEEVEAHVYDATETRPINITPVTARNVAAFPLQCAARDVSFAYRKTILRGRVKNAIVTLLRHVRADEEIAPKHLLWLTRPIALTRVDALSPWTSTTYQGMLVEVVDVPEGGTELVVQVAGRSGTHLVNIHETRRLYECIVGACYVHLAFMPA